LQNLKFQLKAENELIFEAQNDDELKVNDQNNVDRMIAKQIQIQENVEEDTSDDTKPEDTKPLDLDYLLALSMEQEDIMEAVDLFDGDQSEHEIDKKKLSLITDSEIIALLEQPGIDIEALLNTYSTLSREYILNLIKKEKTRNKNNDRKWKKNKRKKRKQYVEDEIFEEEEQKNDEEEEVDEFMKKFKTFNKKSDFIKKQKQHIKDNQNENGDAPNTKKKRRRRRKNKEKNVCVPSKQLPAIPKKPECRRCNKSFLSKNKLYDHLKQFPQHALKE